ncbi:hypothetical protein EVA_16684 [gut metagenome]|uniref:Uncharacterized protein n=1 Tax=gut metagenome TaxID=749906 RepID=J9G089_9ZZZZ
MRAYPRLAGRLHQFIPWNRAIQQALAFARLQFRTLQDASQGPSHFTRTPTTGIVTHITDEERLLVTGHRQVETFFQRMSRSFQGKLMTHIPELLSQFLGSLFHLFLVVTVHHDHSLVARIVSPHIPDPDTRINHSRHRFHFGNQRIQRFGRFYAGAGPFARHQYRHRHPSLIGRFAFARLQAVNQILYTPAMRFTRIVMRSFAISRNQVTVQSHQPRRIAVKVHRRGHHDIVADDSAYLFHEFSFRIGYPLYATSPVVVEPESIVGHIGLDLFQRFVDKLLVRFACHRSAAPTPANLGRQPSSRFPQNRVGMQIIRHMHRLPKNGLPVGHKHTVFYLNACNTDARFFLRSSLWTERPGQQTRTQQEKCFFHCFPRFRYQSNDQRGF